MIAAALLALALLSAALVRVMIGHGVLDIPGHRSSHDRPTPKGGGVGIAAAFLVGFAGADLAGLLPGQGLRVASLLLAAVLIATVAWLDDVRPFGFAPKLAAQCGAALLVVLGGWTIRSVGPLPLGVLAGPVTLAWIIFVVNAVNFADGLNGLASGAVLIAALIAALAAADTAPPLLPATMLPLAAGVVGFLPFNFPRARIFMGDVGSQLCGLVTAAAAAPASQIPDRPWGVVLIPLVLAPLLLDVAFTLVRRLCAGDRLTEAHRGHLYQLTHRAGVAAVRITMLVWALALAGAALGFIASRGPATLVVTSALADVALLGAVGWSSLKKARAAVPERW